MYCKKSTLVFFPLYWENKNLETKRNRSTLLKWHHEMWMEIGREHRFLTQFHQGRKILPRTLATLESPWNPKKKNVAQLSHERNIPPSFTYNSLFHTNHSVLFAKYFRKTKASQQSSLWCEAKQKHPQVHVLSPDKNLLRTSRNEELMDPICGH